ncbi:MAG: ATP-binding protein [Kofleriaceae bacterium]
MDEAKPSKVLFIEDDVGKRYVIARQLRQLGFEVDEATTGKDGLAMVSPDYDLVVLDVRLPDIHGHEIAQKIKSDPRTTTVMVLELSAAAASPSDRATGLDRGADAYLVHPVEIVELVATMRALVRLRRAEQERERQRELFLGMIGHDLRNPLSVMVTGLDMMEASTNLVERDRNTLDRLRRSASRMNYLLDQLLTFSQAVADGVPIAVEPEDLGDVCREAVSDVESQGRTVAIDDRLQAKVSVDRRRIVQLVENLVTNAIRYGEGDITLKLTRDGSWAQISIHNGGTPIPAASIPTLFAPYRRASNRPNGFGLGLFIVDQIARAHHGNVAVRSTAEAGTTFEVRLPA